MKGIPIYVSYPIQLLIYENGKIKVAKKEKSK